MQVSHHLFVLYITKKNWFYILTLSTKLDGQKRPLRLPQYFHLSRFSFNLIILCQATNKGLQCLVSAMKNVDKWHVSQFMKVFMCFSLTHASSIIRISQRISIRCISVPISNETKDEKLISGDIFDKLKNCHSNKSIMNNEFKCM